ncbi:MAG: multifunctional CCA addition/repair protein [Porticoccaceae bacterium]
MTLNTKNYLVGGAVRDKLLGLKVEDRDWVVVGSSPEQMLDQGFKPVGKDFPVFLHPDTAEEYALARTERKVAVGHTGFTFHADPDVTLEEDLARRDLTINAIAEDSDGTLIDPYGGCADLDKRVLRHVSDAFVEDPLRVLRVARFAARFQPFGFTVADETLALMSTIAARGELRHLSPERIWQETEKALVSPSPSTYIETLRVCGALAELFPELDALFGVPQRADYHPEIDTGIHVLMALDQAVKLSDDPGVRFAVLMHDLGKADTPIDVLPRHIGHEAAGVALVKDFCLRLRVPKRYQPLALAVTRYHLQCHKAHSLRPATLLKLFKGIDLFRRPELLEPFLLACEADSRGRLGLEDVDYPSADWLRKLAPQLTDITAAPFVDSGLSGTNIGEAMDKARLQVISGYKKKYDQALDNRTSDNV